MKRTTYLRENQHIQLLLEINRQKAPQFLLMLRTNLNTLKILNPYPRKSSGHLQDTDSVREDPTAGTGSPSNNDNSAGRNGSGGGIRENNDDSSSRDGNLGKEKSELTTTIEIHNWLWNGTTQNSPSFLSEQSLSERASTDTESIFASKDGANNKPRYILTPSIPIYGDVKASPEGIPIPENSDCDTLNESPVVNLGGKDCEIFALDGSYQIEISRDDFIRSILQIENVGLTAEIYGWFRVSGNSMDTVNILPGDYALFYIDGNYRAYRGRIVIASVVSTDDEKPRPIIKDL